MPPPAPRRTFSRLGTFAVGLCLALALWLFAQGTPRAVDTPSLEARLEGAFPGLALERGAGGAARVTGFVATRADAIRVERWLESQPERVVNAVLADAVLAERVADVFRINGIEAEVRTLEDGVAAVATRTDDAAALDRIETRVAADVPRLVALEIENVPPVAAPARTPFDAGKRVALVVGSPPAHLVTEDRSRYYIGAILPSGHRIASIEDNVVLLEKDGATSELQF